MANRFPIANFKEIIEVHGEKTRPEALLMEEPVRTFMENVALIKDEFKAFTSSLGVEHKSEFLELVTDKADELENLYLDIVREGFNTWSVSGESDKKQEIARLVEAGTNYIERLRDIVASVTQASVNYKEVKNALLRLKDRCDNSHNYAASYALEKLLKENEVKFPPLNSVGNVVKYGKIATQLAEALDKGVKKISREDSSARDQMSLMEEMYGDGVVSSEQYQKLRDIFLKEIKTKIDNTIREESAKIRQLNGVPQASEFIEKANEKFKILKELKDEKIQKSGVEAIVNYEDRVNEALMTDPFEGAPENY